VNRLSLTRDRTRTDQWVAPLLAIVAVLHALPALKLPVATLDEIILLDYPDMVRRGATPHVDFYSVYPRLGYDFLALCFDVVGYSSHVERAAGVAYQVAVVLAVSAMTRRFGPRVAIGSGLIAVALMPNDATAFAWLGGLGLALWALVLAGTESSRWAWVAGGVLAGLAVGWRYEMAVVVGLPLLALVVRHRRAAFVVGGGLLGAAPTVWQLLEVGGAAWDNVSGRMGVNFQLESATIPSHVEWALAVGAASIVVLAFGAVRGGTREDWAWLLLALSVVPQAIQRIDTHHVGFAAVVVYPLAFATGLDLAKGAAPGRARAAMGVALVVFLSVPALFLLATVIVAPSSHESRVVTSGSRSLRVPADRAADVGAFIDHVRDVVPTGSALFLGTDRMGRTSFNSYPLYYLLSEEYVFDSYFLELAAGVAERDGSGLSDDIRRADALILARFDPAVGDRLFPFAPRGFSQHDRTVREEFEPVHTSFWTSGGRGVRPGSRRPTDRAATAASPAPGRRSRRRTSRRAPSRAAG
jgi:hypothetical protein